LDDGDVDAAIEAGLGAGDSRYAPNAIAGGNMPRAHRGRRMRDLYEERE
jgi:hypothetical protein